MAPISFRNSKIVYYGPHSCENCGVEIVKMGREFGGTAFTNPEGPIYPNTEWYPHVCDPALVKKHLGSNAEAAVKMNYPGAVPMKIGKMGYIIVAEVSINKGEKAPYHALAISMNQTFIDTIEAAWQSALERMEKGYPSWHIDLTKYDDNSSFGDDLQRLPECPAASI